MKKLLAAFLILVSIFTLTACNDIPDTGTTNSTSETSTEEKIIIQNDPVVKGEWGIYVGFKTSEKENVTPHKEMLYSRKYNDPGDGNGNLYVSNGALMFYKVSEHLPSFASHVPTVKWAEDFQLVYLMDDGIAYRGGETFYVYGEDFTELAKAISRDELIAKSKTDWMGKTVYIQFGGVFYNKINEEITEDIENAYFVKTTF